VRAYLRNFWKDTSGQDMLEYALAAAFMAAAAVAAMPGLPNVVNNLLTSIGGIINNNVR
jgi:Flp pilus assembly pilin Flp